jgi:cytoskeletal protein CcmA (bactofilin family)
MMRKIKLLLGGLSMSVLLLVGYAGLANAHSFRAGTNVIVSSNEKVDESLFVAGNNVDVSSEVFGDVFCAGQTVTVSGTVHGDIICAGQTVTITGAVDGDVRLAGQTVTVSGNVSGNATVASQAFTLSSTSRVGGDLTVTSKSSTLNGSVERDVAAAGETVVVASGVGRNIRGAVTDLQLASSAKVAGDIEFTSNRDVSKADGAVVSGTVTRSEPPRENDVIATKTAAFGVGWLVYAFLAMLAAALALVLLFPRLFHGITNQAMPMPWKALLTGFIASLAVPVVLVVLAITLVGLPLALIVGLAWLLVLLLSGPVFGYYLGRLLLQNSRQPLLIMLAGAGLLFVLYFIPLIGALAMLAALWFGSGMLLQELFARTPRPAYTLAGTPKKKAGR